MDIVKAQFSYLDNVIGARSGIGDCVLAKHRNGLRSEIQCLLLTWRGFLWRQRVGVPPHILIVRLVLLKKDIYQNLE